tara:strand:+ start:17325 stop:17951 length:627 start_codon:yes stop_codon:yes gene_type:complete
MKKFITSIRLQPIILLIRLSYESLYELKLDKLLELINFLYNHNLTNIEIRWEDHKNWKIILKRIKEEFPKILIGAATLRNKDSINNVKELNLDFAMMPFWDKDLMNYANQINQFVIPAIQNENQLSNANKMNCNIIKIYPANELGIEFIKKINTNNINIAAGGLESDDIDIWLKKGYNGLVLGRKVFNNYSLNQKFLNWIKLNQENFH